MSLARYVIETRDPTELAPFQHVMDKDLRVPLERQQQNQWCWAAVALGVAAHYSAPDPPRWKQQCAFVNDFLKDVLPRSNCCGPEGDNRPCNEPRAVAAALKKIGHFEDYAHKVDFATLRREIDGGRPIVLLISRTDRGNTYSHFVVVDAYKASPGGTGNVAIRNPDEPRLDVISHGKLYSKYYGKDWKWDYTFFTKPAGPDERECEPAVGLETQESLGRELDARGTAPCP